MYAKPFNVIVRIVERMNLQLASVAGTRVDMPDGKTSAKSSIDDALNRYAQSLQLIITWRWRCLGQNSDTQTLFQDSKHTNLQIVSGIRGIDGFVADREIRNDVSVNQTLEREPREPARIARKETGNATLLIKSNETDDLTPPAIDHSEGFATARGNQLYRDRPGRHCFQQLVEHAKTLGNLLHSDENTRGDIPIRERRNLQGHLVVGWVRRMYSSVKGRAAGLADIASTTKGPGVFHSQHAGTYQTIIKRRVILHNIEQADRVTTELFMVGCQYVNLPRIEVDADTAGDHGIHEQPVPEDLGTSSLPRFAQP